MARVGWNFRIDGDLDKQARAYCKENGHSLTWLVETSVSQFLDGSTSELEELKQRLDKLEGK